MRDRMNSETPTPDPGAKALSVGRDLLFEAALLLGEWPNGPMEPYDKSDARDLRRKIHEFLRITSPILPTLPVIAPTIPEPGAKAREALEKIENLAGDAAFSFRSQSKSWIFTMFDDIRAYARQAIQSLPTLPAPVEAEGTAPKHGYGIGQAYSLREAAIKFAKAWATWHDHGGAMPDNEVIDGASGILEALGVTFEEGEDGKHVLINITPPPPEQQGGRG